MSENNTLYNLLGKLKRSQKKYIGYELLQNEKLHAGKSQTLLVFKTAVKYSVADDAQLWKKLPEGTDIANLSQIKRRLVTIILDFLTITAKDAASTLAILCVQIDILLDKELWSEIPDLIYRAIDLARQTFKFQTSIELHNKLEAVYTASPALKSVQSAIRDARLIEMDLKGAVYNVESLKLYNESRKILFETNDLELARNLLKSPWLRRKREASFPAHIKTLKAEYNLHMALKDRSAAQEALTTLINLSQSNEAIYMPELRATMPLIIYNSGLHSLELEDIDSFDAACALLRKTARSSTMQKETCMIYYYRLRFARCFADGNDDKVKKALDILQEEITADTSGITTSTHPQLCGPAATYHFSRGDWAGANKWCTRYLTAENLPYESRLTFSMMRLISNYEANHIDRLGGMAREAIAALGSKNLGPVEDSLLHYFKSVKASSTPDQVKSGLSEIKPQLLQSIKQARYRTVEEFIRFTDWLLKI